MARAGQSTGKDTTAKRLDAHRLSVAPMMDWTDYIYKTMP
jgi:hypothetical protein